MFETHSDQFLRFIVKAAPYHIVTFKVLFHLVLLYNMCAQVSPFQFTLAVVGNWNSFRDLKMLTWA